LIELVSQKTCPPGLQFFAANRKIRGGTLQPAKIFQQSGGKGYSLMPENPGVPVKITAKDNYRRN
jgi:hypothetical protein